MKNASLRQGHNCRAFPCRRGHRRLRGPCLVVSRRALSSTAVWQVSDLIRQALPDLNDLTYWLIGRGAFFEDRKRSTVGAPYATPSPHPSAERVPHMKTRQLFYLFNIAAGLSLR